MIRLGSLLVALLLFSGCLNREKNASKELGPNVESEISNVSNDSLLNVLLGSNQGSDSKAGKPDSGMSKEDSVFQQQVMADTLGDCNKCDITYVSNVESNISIINKEDLRKFFCTYRYSCVDNVEFGEFFNEVLFLVLEKQSRIAIEILKSDETINVELLLKEMQSPIHDGINVKEIRQVVERNSIKGDFTDKVLNALQIAIDKYN